MAALLCDLLGPALFRSKRPRVVSVEVLSVQLAAQDISPRCPSSVIEVCVPPHGGGGGGGNQ